MRCKRSVLTILLFMGIVLLACAVFFVVRNNSIYIRSGTLDLSEWNGRSAIPLIGKAELFSNELKSLKITETDSPDGMVTFPSYFIGKGTAVKQSSGIRYNTYRIHVTGAVPGQLLALRVPPYLSAYRIIIDGQTRQPRDESASQEDRTLSRYEVETFEFRPVRESFDILIQLSDSEGRCSAACSLIYLGTAGQIEKINSVISGFDIFVIAFLLVVICYNIFYYFLRKDMFFVAFILLCLMMIGRTMISGSFLIGGFFSETGRFAAFYIDCLTMFFLPAVWLLTTYFSNSVVLPKKAVLLSGLFAVAAAIALLSIKPSSMMLLYLFSEAVWLVAAVYVIWKSVTAVVEGKLNKTVTALLLSGVAILIFCTILDIIQSVFSGRGLLDFLPIGLVIFTLMWDYSYTYQYNALLQDRLKVLEDLNRANEKGRSLELKFLRSQIRPHFINNVLNTIIAVSLTDQEKARGLLCNFSTYLKSCYDFGEPNGCIPIEHELSAIKAYIALEEARYTDSLKVEFKIDSVSVDIPPLILQPLVENAIKHNKISRKSPLSVCVYVTKQEESVLMGVIDDGQGFDTAAISSLLNDEPNGRGVGLYNVNMRLLKIYGTQIKIENSDGGGCNVYMIIPNNNNSLE